MPGNRLVFVGVIESVTGLHKIRGLVPGPDQVFRLDTSRSNRLLVEAGGAHPPALAAILAGMVTAKTAAILLLAQDLLSVLLALLRELA